MAENSTLKLARKAIQLINARSTQVFDVPKVVRSVDNVPQSVYLLADGGENETIKIHSRQGTSNNAVDIVADEGGVNVEANNNVVLDGGLAVRIRHGTAGFTVEKPPAVAIGGDGVLDASTVRRNGIFTHALGADTVVTLPNFENLYVGAMSDPAVGDTFQVALINTSGANTLTINDSVDGSVTVVGNNILPVQTSRTLYIRTTSLVEDEEEAIAYL